MMKPSGMKKIYRISAVIPLLLLSSCQMVQPLQKDTVVEPSASSDSYYSYEDTVGLKHLSKNEPVQSLVEPSYEQVEAYIKSMEYYANIDAINPDVKVMTMDDDTIFIHFNSNGDEGFMIKASEYGYIIQRSYLNTQRFTYAKDGQTREAVMYITNHRNYFNDASLPNEYFISLGVPNSDNDTNYQIYYDRNRKSFYTTDTNGCYEDVITFTHDLEITMVNTMEYVLPIFETVDDQGIQFVVELLFDYYQLPFVLLASPVEDIGDERYEQFVFMNKEEYDPLNATTIPHGFTDPADPYRENIMVNSVYMDEQSLESGEIFRTVVNVRCYNGDIYNPWFTTITSYIDGQQIEATELITHYGLIDPDMINKVKDWFMNNGDQTTVDPDLLDTTQLSFSEFENAGIIGSFGLYDGQLIFTTYGAKDSRTDVLVCLKNE